MKGSLIWIWVLSLFWGGCAQQGTPGCLTGAFLADVPTAEAIDNFRTDYGKKPFFVLLFLDWGKFPDENVIRDVYENGSVLMITWEPWSAAAKEGIDYKGLPQGRYDSYLREFAIHLKRIGKPVFLRFAHEMNGDWYPWSAQKIGGKEYQRIFRYVHEIFDREAVNNVRWVFSINAEDVPVTNRYFVCYPGDRYVDYIGLDGYNWGTTQPWSRWRSFHEIFSPVYQDVTRRFRKPVMISEFSSTSTGGDQARWIADALKQVKQWPEVKAVILFNVDKETDWRFRPDSAAGSQLKAALADPYFKDGPEGNFP